MKPTAQVASPPTKPLMTYDGDCGFCALWIRRWREATGDRVEYLPYQDPRIAVQFPEIPREQFESAVQLIAPDGSVFHAAEAVFRSLACNPHERWLLDLYRDFPVFAAIAEWCYRLVANHRKWFSFLTWLLWGRHLESPSHALVRWTFLRSLGIIYLIAFVSLWVQITGLIGSHGIVPAAWTMEAARRQVAAAHIDSDRYRLMPTLCWVSASDGFLKAHCAAGTALAALLIVGIAPAPCLFLLWLIYLSLTTVCGVFLGFQWDNLLLEAGFLAIFFAPLQWSPRHPSREAPPSRLVLWLLRWLVFRLMFESGCVKWLSGDPAWRNLTALNFHYETQPLPTWIGWYAHQLPAWFQKGNTAVMFAIELGVPFLIFLPRRPRQFACLAFITLQFLILLTGNYCFFNLLTMVICLTLLDDAALQAVSTKYSALTRKIFCRRRGPAGPEPAFDSAALAAANGAALRNAPHRARWPLLVTLPLSAVVLALSLVQLLAMFGVPIPAQHPVAAFHRWLAPFRTVNGYGLFRVMTTTRPEIVVEGSNDGVTWQAYEFRYKPGDVMRRPRFVEPHQPRLDWQMWFTALGDRNPWFVNFCLRLLQGSPEVLALLERNPFPDAPPRYVRAVLYEYHFTDLETRRKTGAWWRRELKGILIPPLSLREQ